MLSNALSILADAGAGATATRPAAPAATIGPIEQAIAAGADTVVVDSYAYLSHEVVDDRATGRTSPAPGVWVVFDALNPYSGTTLPLGNGCVPTPALANDCTPEVPVEGATWGSIKYRYDG